MRVIVLFPGALGDLCLLAPAIAVTAASGIHVELSVPRSLMPVVTMLLPSVALGPPIDGAELATLFAGQPSSALRRWFDGADRVHAWLGRGDADGGLTACLDALGVATRMHTVPRTDGEHHVGEEYAAALGLTGPQPPVYAMPSMASLALPWRRSQAARLVVHPGAGAHAKCWALDGFRSVADHWIEDEGEAVILLGPAEEGDAGSWKAGGYEPLMGLSLAEAAALIASAPSWIGNDSGMSHLAGALGRRGVVLFGPTRPERWRPRSGSLATVAFDGRSIAVVAREVIANLRIALAAS